jgi:hypothetical protein
MSSITATTAKPLTITEMPPIAIAAVEGAVATALEIDFDPEA